MSSDEGQNILSEHRRKYLDFAHNLADCVTEEQAAILSRVQGLFLAKTPGLMRQVESAGVAALDRARDLLLEYAPDLADSSCAVSAVASLCQMMACLEIDRSGTDMYQSSVSKWRRQFGAGPRGIKIHDDSDDPMDM